MRKHILAGAAALALAAGVTTGAMAADYKAGHGARHFTRVHANGLIAPRHGSRFAGTGPHHGGWDAGSPYGRGGYRDLGPLGMTFGCAHGYCGQGYSVSAWSY